MWGQTSSSWCQHGQERDSGALILPCTLLINNAFCLFIVLKFASCHIGRLLKTFKWCVQERNKFFY